jgi:hypothetical protein
MARLGTNHRKENDLKNYLRGMREPVCYDCEGCARVDVIDKSLCGAYIIPEKMWTRGTCPAATHIKTEEDKKAERVRVGQQKQKKKTKK